MTFFLLFLFVSIFCGCLLSTTTATTVKSINGLLLQQQQEQQQQTNSNNNNNNNNNNHDHYNEIICRLTVVDTIIVSNVFTTTDDDEEEKKQTTTRDANNNNNAHNSYISSLHETNDFELFRTQHLRVGGSTTTVIGSADSSTRDSTTKTNVNQIQQQEQEQEQQQQQQQQELEQHDISCIPIVNDMELDFLLSIEKSILPIDFIQAYQNEIHQGLLLVKIIGNEFQWNHPVYPTSIIRVVVDQQKQTQQQGNNVVVVPTTTFVVLNNRNQNQTTEEKEEDNNNLPHLRTVSKQQQQTQPPLLDVAPIMNITFVYITTEDSVPSYTSQQLREHHTNTSGINFINQFQLCSFQQLQFQLHHVIDVHLQNHSITEYKSGSEIVNAVMEQMMNDEQYSYMIPFHLFSHRMVFCVPPGSTGNWAASAGVRHWKIQMNDIWCLSLSGLMHELGHTMGLLHSHADNNPYGDRTGYMGSGSPQTNTPQKCYNGYNLYQFQWYLSNHYDILHSNNNLLTSLYDNPLLLLNVAAFVDYDHVRNYERDTNYTDFLPIIININYKYYIHYNRATYFNEGTEQKQDQIVISEPIEGGSNSIIGLKEGEKYVIHNYNNPSSYNNNIINNNNSNQSLIIEVCYRNDRYGTNKNINTMMISIGINYSRCHNSFLIQQNRNNTTTPTSSSSFVVDNNNNTVNNTTTTYINNTIYSYTYLMEDEKINSTHLLTTVVADKETNHIQSNDESTTTTITTNITNNITAQSDDETTITNDTNLVETTTNITNNYIDTGSKSNNTIGINTSNDSMNNTNQTTSNNYTMDDNILSNTNGNTVVPNTTNTSNQNNSGEFTFNTIPNGSTITDDMMTDNKERPPPLPPPLMKKNQEKVSGGNNHTTVTTTQQRPPPYYTYNDVHSDKNSFLNRLFHILSQSDTIVPNNNNVNETSHDR